MAVQQRVWMLLAVMNTQHVPDPDEQKTPRPSQAAAMEIDFKIAKMHAIPLVPLQSTETQMSILCLCVRKC